MKFLFELFPVVVFFAAYYIPEDGPDRMSIAIAAVIVAVIFQVAIHWLIYRTVTKLQLITLAAILVLGGASLLTQDKRFFLWKPTVVNWLFAAVFLGSEFIGKKNFTRRMMEKAVTLPALVWTRLNYSWVSFFLLLGATNLYVAFNFAENIWVNFKLFGMVGLTLLFTIAQLCYLSKYIKDKDPIA